MSHISIIKKELKLVFGMILKLNKINCIFEVCNHCPKTLRAIRLGLRQTKDIKLIFEFKWKNLKFSEWLKKDITVGDKFSGRFTYDINSVYLHTIDQESYGISIKIGKRTFAFSDISAGVENNYYDCNSGTTYDSFYLNSENPDGRYDSISLNMTLIDYSSASLKNNIFLPAKFEMASWDENNFCINSTDPSDDLSGFTIRGVLNKIISDIDSDGDGTPDHSDNCPDDPKKTEPGICGCGNADSDRDSDGDGTWDCKDACPDDPGKIVPGICGCGVPDIDSDGDGSMDCYDVCPNDPNKAEPGACGCGQLDIDTDGDGISDCVDRCPHDPEKAEPGICGCNIPDTDSDGDGTIDCRDADDDNDGMPDEAEHGPDGLDPDYDGNNDGAADCLQENVVSFHSWNDAVYITLESSVGTSISRFTVSENPFPPDTPPDIEFVYGFFELTIEGVRVGGDLTVRLYFPVGNFFHTYYKYGPTPDRTDNHWYEFLYNGQTGAEMGKNIITIHFIDGMRGDDDLSVNGTIVDTGGPGILLNFGEGGGGGFFLSTPPALH